MNSILDRVLQAARQLGASDVHLKAGLPPIFRIKGDLRTVRDVPPADPRRAADLRARHHERPPARDLRAPLGRRPGLRHQRRRPLPRQRLPAARRRRHGHAADSARRAALPETEPAGRSAGPGRFRARHGAGHRRHRVGQVDHARGDGRLHQLETCLPHRHHRGSDRVRVQGSPQRDQPARDRLRHDVVRQGAARGAAPGPGRDLRRRDARPRDHRDRDAGRRDRAPAGVDAAHARRRRDHQPHRVGLHAAPAGAGAAAAGRRAQRRRSRSGWSSAPTARG